MNLFDLAVLAAALAVALLSLWPLVWTVLFLVAPCPRCHGLRRYTEGKRVGVGTRWEPVTCAACGGSGWKVRGRR